MCDGRLYFAPFRHDSIIPQLNHKSRLNMSDLRYEKFLDENPIQGLQFTSHRQKQWCSSSTTLHKRISTSLPVDKAARHSLWSFPAWEIRGSKKILIWSPWYEWKWWYINVQETWLYARYIVHHGWCGFNLYVIKNFRTLAQQTPQDYLLQAAMGTCGGGRISHRIRIQSNIDTKSRST